MNARVYDVNVWCDKACCDVQHPEAKQSAAMFKTPVTCLCYWWSWIDTRTRCFETDKRNTKNCVCALKHVSVCVERVVCMCMYTCIYKSTIQHYTTYACLHAWLCGLGCYRCHAQAKCLCGTRKVYVLREKHHRFHRKGGNNCNYWSSSPPWEDSQWACNALRSQ